jgi:hypothetical protein
MWKGSNVTVLRTVSLFIVNNVNYSLFFLFQELINHGWEVRKILLESVVQVRFKSSKICYKIDHIFVVPNRFLGQAKS